MKKIIQVLIIMILTLVLSLIIVFIFNPFNSRTKLIGSFINAYLSSNIENYTSLEKIKASVPSASSIEGDVQINNKEAIADKHPLLNEAQEGKLEEYGVNVEKLPSVVTEGMKTCFIEKLGQERAAVLIDGDAPNAVEVFKVRECIGR